MNNSKSSQCPKCGSEGYKEKIEAKYRELARKLLEGVQGAGYHFSEKNEFYIDPNFRVGIKVGQYSHSCHIGATDFFVLLMEKDYGKGDFGIEEFESEILEKVNI